MLFLHKLVPKWLHLSEDTGQTACPYTIQNLSFTIITTYNHNRDVSYSFRILIRRPVLNLHKIHGDQNDTRADFKEFNVEYDLRNLVECYMKTLNIINYIQHINLSFKI
jgi:hypothetical protein